MAEGSGGEDLKDVTITSFGLLIAYLLPGLVGLYGLSFWAPPLQTAFGIFLTSESNVGLFLIIVLAALVVGLLAHGVRWLIFEVLFSSSTYRLDPSVYAHLSGERKLTAFRTAIDEFSRYHQWWGGVAVVGPIGFVGWLVGGGFSNLKWTSKVSSIVLFALLETLCFYVAWKVWGLCVLRITSILKGGNEMGGAPSPSPTPSPSPSPTPQG